MNKHFLVSLVLILSFALSAPSGISAGYQTLENQVQDYLYFPIILYSFVEPVQPTKTPKPTQTRTPTRTMVPFRTSTPQPTATTTPTNTLTPTFTLTPTKTSTTTLIPMVVITVQFPSSTPTFTPTTTPSQTVTPSETPSPGIVPGISPRSWLIILLLGLLWMILAAWLIIFLRQRRDTAQN